MFFINKNRRFFLQKGFHLLVFWKFRCILLCELLGNTKTRYYYDCFIRFQSMQDQPWPKTPCLQLKKLLVSPWISFKKSAVFSCKRNAFFPKKSWVNTASKRLPRFSWKPLAIKPEVWRQAAKLFCRKTGFWFFPFNSRIISFCRSRKTDKCQ